MSASYLQGIHNICSVNDFGKSRYNWVHDKACNNRQRGIHTMPTGIKFKATQSRCPELAEVLVLKMFTNQGNPFLSYYTPAPETWNCSRDLFLHASVHMARHVWTWCNMAVLFYALLDIFFLFMQWDYGKFILKQLDYSPSFSTSDSQARSLIVN